MAGLFCAIFLKTMKYFFFLSSLLLLASCGQEDTDKTERKPQTDNSRNAETKVTRTSLVVLGNVQDAGSPHAACKKDCCKDLFENPDAARMVVSLGLIDCEARKTYLFEATPDIARQMKLLKEMAPFDAKEIPDGILLTHAHIGHYTGLMFLGKEACNAQKAPVYAMPQMKAFLEENGPWNQLVTLGNIALHAVEHEEAIHLSEGIRVTPFLVPHRDEYSETVGYLIEGPKKTALFIPDIDKWERWDADIREVLEMVDYAFIDATFYNGAELNTRDISQIPHPFVVETMELMKELSQTAKAKVHFIHFNHTNALLQPESNASKTVIKNGFNIARLGDRFEM